MLEKLWGGLPTMTEHYGVKYLGVLSPRPEVYHGDRAMSPEACANKLNELQQAVIEAHRILAHEINEGRTPALLPVDKGGKGLGYFEDVVNGYTR